MPPYGLISLADRPFGVTDITLGVDIPEELAARGYGEDILYDYDPAFGGLKTTERYQPAPFTGARPFQAMYDIAPYTSNGINLGFNADLYNPSFGGVSGYRDTGGIMGIEPVRYSADFDTSYGVANEEDEEQVEYLPGQEPSGMEKLFNKVQNIPGAVKSGLLSLIGKVNPALSFIGGGLSSIVNLPKFFQERRDARARAEAAERGAAKQQEMARQTAFQAMRGNDAYGGGGGRPGGFGQGAGDFSASDPTATEGSF